MPEREDGQTYFCCKDRHVSATRQYGREEEGMYQKEIIYMGLYKNGTRIGSAGFVKVEIREQDSRLYLKTQNIPHSISGRFPIRVYNGSEWKELNGITIQDGGGIWEDALAGRTNHAMLQVMLPGGYLLEGKSKSALQSQQGAEVRRESTGQQSAEARNEAAMPRGAETRNEAVMPTGAEARNEAAMPGGVEARSEAAMPGDAEVRSEAAMLGGGEVRSEAAMPGETKTHSETIMPRAVESHSEAALPEETKVRDEDSMQRRTDKPPVVIVKEELPRRAMQELHSMPENTAVYPLKEDKWEQILDTYEQIHPYGDERVYVKLEPKDFVILQSNYQHLVNNSFLLHGFYNYRYLILGKEQDYYLGVPGVFYEREKMVALMFGFEAFECPGGNVRAGEFGYYLRKVEL